MLASSLSKSLRRSATFKFGDLAVSDDNTKILATASKAIEDNGHGPTLYVAVGKQSHGRNIHQLEDHPDPQPPHYPGVSIKEAMGFRRFSLRSQPNKAQSSSRKTASRKISLRSDRLLGYDSEPRWGGELCGAAVSERLSLSCLWFTFFRSRGSRTQLIRGWDARITP